MSAVQPPVCRCESSEESLESCSHPGLVSREFTNNSDPIEKGGTAVRTAGAVLLHHGGASGARNVTILVCNSTCLSCNSNGIEKIMSENTFI